MAESSWDFHKERKRGLAAKGDLNKRGKKAKRRDPLKQRYESLRNDRKRIHHHEKLTVLGQITVWGYLVREVKESEGHRLDEVQVVF